MSRNKGKVGEREAAELLRNYGFDARRGVQFQGGPDSPDVVGLPGHHIEVKRCEALSVYTALEQATADRAEGLVPVVLHRRNNRQWIAVLNATDYLMLVRRAQRAT
jgi:Holliday junction resolvase